MSPLRLLPPTKSNFILILELMSSIPLTKWSLSSIPMGLI